ncbi:hypothetical protein D3C72_2243770 [compost metagenome]
MQKQNRFAVRTNLWLTNAEDARTFGPETIAGSNNIGDLIAKVMHAARWIFFEEGGNG